MLYLGAAVRILSEGEPAREKRIANMPTQGALKHQKQSVRYFSTDEASQSALHQISLSRET